MSDEVGPVETAIRVAQDVAYRHGKLSECGNRARNAFCSLCQQEDVREAFLAGVKYEQNRFGAASELVADAFAYQTLRRTLKRLAGWLGDRHAEQIGLTSFTYAYVDTHDAIQTFLAEEQAKIKEKT